MLDDLREQAGNMDYFEEEDADTDDDAKISQGSTLFLGMTATQRFVIAFMILLMICIMGTFFLVVTEKIVLPFF